MSENGFRSDAEKLESIAAELHSLRVLINNRCAMAQATRRRVVSAGRNMDWMLERCDQLVSMQRAIERRMRLARATEVTRGRAAA